MTYIAPLSPFGPPYVGGEGIPQLIKDRIYKLMGIEDSGWALICVENSCHYVDPDNLEADAELGDALD
ncbi:hypothetical protein [Phormidium pseudopriestleyi]|uniref:hypothetical protein n=1 Tax=Phormidium pseudopriestleyi TaxID=1759527 RepID=UPI001A8CCF7B|nr:hypothetical protein [Phormidium pseudopriestleyi]